MLKTVLALTLLLAATGVDAKVYKWVDENGEVHYSEGTPGQQQAKELAAPPPPQPGASSG